VGAIPLLGFGTWQITGPTARSATEAALAAGYRHLDTATVYRNEREVGAALQASGVARDDVFVTTKCPPDRAGQARQVLEQSLEQLGLERVDLWLVHWPGGGLPLWQAFLAAREDGLVVTSASATTPSTCWTSSSAPRGCCPPSTRSGGVRCTTIPPSSRATATAASCSRATAPCAAARWSTP
jgi:aryl-alcohol dehydrogenase-like predicted oxidoreductase